MHGLPRASDLSFLIGKEICQVAIGSHDVQFNWGSGGISVWSSFLYKLAGAADEVFWADENPEIAARTVRLLKASITDVKCSDRGSLELGFSNGDRLEIFEDERYESFSIHDGKAPVLIV
jgi:Family of unknown function (DUF6188)